jgi:hypothetical protein
LEGYLHGRIVEGDYANVVYLIRTNPKVLRIFHLNSPGGDAAEAIKIGRLFRERLLETRAPMDWGTGQPELRANGGSDAVCTGAECTCTSACALIWFGGIRRLGVVGLHRPRIEDQSFKALAAADASAAYRQVLGTISNYLAEMDAPQSIIDTMVATSSSEVRWVSAKRDNLAEPPSITEWIDASCRPMSEDQRAYSAMPNEMPRSQRLFGDQLALKDRLDKVREERIDCEEALLSREVDKLPRP